MTPRRAKPSWAWRFHEATVTLPTWARDRPHRLLYWSTASGDRQLHHLDTRTGHRQQVTTVAGGASSGAICPQGSHVWWFRDRHGDEHGRWQVTSLDDGQTRPTGDSGHPTGIALGNDVAAIGMSIAGRSTISLWTATGNIRMIFDDPARCTVAGISADDTLVCLTHQRGTDARHPVLAVVDLDGAPVAAWHEPGPRRAWPGEWSPVAGDRRLLIHHEPEDRRRPAIWSPDQNKVEPVEVDLPGDVSATWYPTADALLLRHDLDGSSQLLRWADGRVTTLPTPRGHVAAAARVHPDGQLWVAHSAGDQPPRLRGLPHDIASPAPAPTSHARYHDVRAEDVYGFIAMPRPGSGPAPAVVLLHGGPAVHDADSFSPEVQAWVDEGFAVVLVNYAGSTGYGCRWRESIREHPGPGLRELDDIAAIRTQLVQDGLINPAQVAIAGRSWGGYLALLALGRQPDLWCLGLAIAPIADWATTYEDELPATREHDRALFGGSPAELPDFYAERSPITFADHVRAPLLMVVSRNDPHTPRRQIDNYARRLTAAEATFELHEVEVGHAPRTIADQIEIQRVQIDFAVRHLGSRP